MTDNNSNLQAENKLIAARREKLQQLRQQKGGAYPNSFKRSAFAADLQQKYQQQSKQQLEELAENYSVAGRIMLSRGPFMVLEDGSGRIQIYADRKNLEPELLTQIKSWDLGDIVGVSGTLARSGRGDLYVDISAATMLSKCLRPLPEKHKGLQDTELRYRQRYLDLLSNEDSRQVFAKRTAIIRYIRSFLDQRGFVEVETPMMQPIPGGATARPFTTHHNALNMDLYLRIAPELYLKRLLVGNMERVYEINRNFRNEGLSTRHNPEFTMLEFYQAYATVDDLIELTETLLRKIAEDVMQNSVIEAEGNRYDFAQKFSQLTVAEAVLKYNQSLDEKQLNDAAALGEYARQLGIHTAENAAAGQLLIDIFEHNVEQELIQPTFITEYPIEVSPLARRNDANPQVTDRFELFIGGKEIANGFSELNDPEDQAARFLEQARAKDAGDNEAMHYDAEYITALEYAMPPAAGQGIGIDRLVMMFTDSASIKDVLLFPHMRPEQDND